MAKRRKKATKTTAKKAAKKPTKTRAKKRAAGQKRRKPQAGMTMFEQLLGIFAGPDTRKT